MLKNQLQNFAIIVIIALFSSCGTSKKTIVSTGERELVILSVNDMHAAIDNFPKFAYLVDSLRVVYPDMLLVAGGDNQTGNPVNDQYVPKGLPMIELMNAVGFDLCTVGNHEFDTGQKGFSFLQDKANFEFISANYHNPTYSNVNVAPYKVLTMKNGLKVAFLGLVQINENGIPDSHPKNVKGIQFFNPFKTALKYAFLEKESNVFIALTHLGFKDDMRLAETMEGKGLDLIIGGHTNTLVEKKLLHHGTMITQVDWKLKYATLIKIKTKNGKVISREMQLINLKNRTKGNSKIRAMVDKYNDNPELNKVIANTPYELTGKTPLGYLMTDALRELGKVDMVFQNRGGVRIKHLPKGDITAMDVYRMDPFGNELIVLNLTGQEIENFLKLAYEIDGGYPEFMSGVTVKYIIDGNRKLKEVKIMMPDGGSIDSNKTYKVGMNSYIVAAYKFKHTDPGTSLFKPTAEYTIEYLKKRKTIKNYQNEKRVEIVKE